MRRKGNVLSRSLAGVAFACLSLRTGDAAPASPAPGKQALASPSAGDRDRYIALLERKRRAERLAALSKLEADLSAKKKTYVVLDLSERRLYFKVRGRVFKALALNGVQLTPGTAPGDPAGLAGRVYTLQLKEGKGVDTESITMRSLTPEEAERAGGKDAESLPSVTAQGEVTSGGGPTRSTAGTGAPAATQKLAGVAGGAIPPDPPPRYHLGFDGGLSVWVVADVERDQETVFFDRILSFAKRIGRFLAHRDAAIEERQITLRLTLDRGRQLFRQIICGEQLLISP